jgi:hypothetical protein
MQYWSWWREPWFAGDMQTERDRPATEAERNQGAVFPTVRAHVVVWAAGAGHGETHWVSGLHKHGESDTEVFLVMLQGPVDFVRGIDDRIRALHS